jgi:RimJ/RimL family protein N-acetyltransferase
MSSPAAYRIETERLVVRCWDPRDAVGVKDAIDTSLDALREWMPWAHNEPTSLADKVALLRGFRGKFDLDQDYVYGVLPRDESRVLGGTGLHPRGDEGSREIGYWIRTDSMGNGYATELTAALTKVAFEVLELRRVEIWTEVRNARSARVPEKLGYTREGPLRQRRLVRPDEWADMDVWTLLADEYPSTPAADAALVAYDAAGGRMLG